MNFWIIGDTHFGHDNIIEYCNRPPHFETTLLQNIYQVPPRDVLIHLGDIAFKHDAMWHGKLFDDNRATPLGWLVTGNHDKRTLSWYISKGWAFVGHSLSLNIYGKRLLFTHEPAYQLGEYDLNIHGHLHNTGHRPAHLTEKHLLYAPENEGYAPVRLDRLIHLRRE